MAMEVCEPLELAYQELEPRRPFSDQQMALWLVFAQCLRDNGIAVEDPDRAEGVAPLPDPIRYRDQRALLEQAMQACKDERLAARSAP